MNFIIGKPALSQEEFLQALTSQFPTLAEEVLDEDYAGLIHLQASCLARYANELIWTARLDLLERVFHFFREIIDKVDLDPENALYVSFLEHIEMAGNAANEQAAP